VTDEDYTTRKLAAELLGRLGHRSAIEPLIAATTDASWEVRQAAFVALAALFGNVPELLEHLPRALSDSNPAVRIEGVRLLSDTKQPEVLRLLESAVNDDNDLVKVEIAERLGQLGNKRGAVMLLEMADRSRTVHDNYLASRTAN